MQQSEVHVDPKLPVSSPPILTPSGSHTFVLLVCESVRERDLNAHSDEYVISRQH